MFVCPLKGFKTNGKKNADLCNDWDRFVLPTEVLACLFFSDFLKGGGLPQYTILGSHSFMLHLNSQCTQKAEDLFLLYDLLYPWGKGSTEQSKGVMAIAQVLSSACRFPKAVCRNILLSNIWNMVEVWKRGEPLGFCFARC